MSTLALLSIAALLGARVVKADICYDGYGRRYYCNRNGLSWGARLGIGIGIAVAVIVLFSLCGYWRRRQVRSAFSKYKPPALPFTGNNSNGQNPYANNPPPPQGQWNQGQSTYGGNSNYAGNPYGNNPAPPAQTYQPSMAGQYNSRNDTANPNAGEGEHEHGYEWEQAREAERLEREQAQAGGGGLAGPPGYDVATSPQNTGSNNTQYAPPPGAPPKKTTEGTV
ncbi:hypothetical protein I317_00673 [Kwoniella heveanensis CBS 569]|nr:hypothetical protein I317_00673 [Kwoniella heveanensis CBS 569]